MFEENSVQKSIMSEKIKVRKTYVFSSTKIQISERSLVESGDGRTGGKVMYKKRDKNVIMTELNLLK